MTPKKIAIDQILLDPNNYRFHDTEGYFDTPRKRFSEDRVQEKTRDRLQRHENLDVLKKSILKNGFIPIESVVVEPLSDDSDLHVVVEGNRRIAAIKSLVSEFDDGAPHDAASIDSLRTITVVVLDSESDSITSKALMGIRHVSGVKKWGGYQQAKLVTDLADGNNLSTAEISDRLAMTPIEVNRRYRAFKALQQMQTNEEFGEHATPQMYPIFHELVSTTTLKDWLEWREECSKFNNEEELLKLYSLLTPSDDADGNRIRDPKIVSYQQVRAMRDIRSDEDAWDCLFDDLKSFEDAHAIAKRDDIANNWLADIRRASNALRKLETQVLKSLNDEQVEAIHLLIAVAKERLEDASKLKE